MDKNNIIYEYQFGFRQKHSTKQAIISLINKITSCIDSGDLMIGVFLDLKKAFDTVITPYLLERCIRYFNVSELLFTVLYSDDACFLLGEKHRENIIICLNNELKEKTLPLGSNPEN